MSKVIVVTGASRGIGAATARLAAARGWSVAVNYRSERAAAEAVADEVARAGARAVVVQGDVTEESDVARLFETTAGELGAPDGVVVNAGIVAPKSRVEDMDLARIERMMRVNVVGAMLCAREGVRRMSTRRGGAGGSIVVVSSAASRLGGPGEYVDYAASKGAMDSMTIGLAKEVAEDGIRVNAVRPGLIHTDIHASGGQPGRVERMKEGVPLKRGGTAEEVAHAIVWLLGDEASYVTGALLDVSGGR